MNRTTTRAHAGRAAAETRRGSRSQARPRRDGSHGAHVDGANALQIGYADPQELFAPPATEPRRRTRPWSTPARSTPARSTPARSTPAIHTPAAPPLPVALPRAPFLVSVLGMVVVGVLGVLVLNTKINEYSFRLDALQSEQSALDLQEQQLSQELSDLESPGNLRAAAKRLGLVPAGTPAFISLPDGRVIGVPQPAKGQSTAALASADPGR